MLYKATAKQGLALLSAIVFWARGLLLGTATFNTAYRCYFMSCDIKCRVFYFRFVFRHFSDLARAFMADSTGLVGYFKLK
jgi:hypothetical protein